MKLRRDIEGIRGIGVLAVLFAHLGVAALAGSYVMVDAFYVVSGFVITGTLIAEHQRRVAAGLTPGFSLMGFYLRRLKRIFPMATLVSAVTVWLAHEFWNPLRAAGVYRDAVWAFFSGGNINEIRKATDYFANYASQSPLAHYWSLAVEEQFYFVWPILALITMRWGMSRTGSWQRMMVLILGGIWVVSLTYSIWYTFANITAAYFSTFTRAWELASGALLAILVQQERFKAWVGDARRARLLWLVGVVCVTLAATTFDSNTWFPGYAALLPVLGSVATIAAGSNETIARFRLFDNPILVFCGRISFSLYLWHWPVIVFLPSLFPGLSAGQGLLSTSGKFVAVAVAFTLAVVGYVTVERPIIRWQVGVPAQFRRVPQPGRTLTLLRGSALSVAVVWVLVGAALLATNRQAPVAAVQPDVAESVLPAVIDHQELTLTGQVQDGPLTVAWRNQLQRNVQSLVDQATPAQIQSIKEARFWPNSQGWVCDSGGVQCMYGSPSATTRVLVIGDYHAYMWADAFRAIVDRNPSVAVSLSGTGQCPNMLNLRDIESLPAAQRAIAFKKCKEYHDWILKNAPVLKPTLIVFSDYTEGYLASIASSAYMRGHVQFIEWAKRTAQDVMILGSTPSWPTPSTCLSRDFTNVLRCVTTINSVGYSTRFQRDAAKLTNIAYVETVNWFCVRARCPLFVGDIVVTPDGGHLNQSLGKEVADVLWENLRQRMKP